MQKIVGGYIESDDIWLLGISGWIIPVVIFSLLYFFMGKWIALCAFLLVLFYLFRSHSDLKPALTSSAFVCILFLVLSITARSAFISNVVLPSYFDSAEHYGIIKNILEGEFLFPFRYYHVGNHYVVAFVASLMHIDIATVMLVLGQVVLALIPLSLYFLVRQATGSAAAGWFAVALSAFGWSMPAHAVDWGKYPALLSLGLIPFVCGLFFLYYKNSYRLMLLMLVVASMVTTIFIHTRSAVVFGLMCLVWFITVWWEKRSKRFSLPFMKNPKGLLLKSSPVPDARRPLGFPVKGREFLFIVVLTFVVVMSVIIFRSEIFRLVFDPYLNKGVVVTLFVLALSAFAWKEYSRWVFAFALFIFLLLVCIFVPIQIPAYGTVTLLDRPYVEMFLFLPLSMLGGVGVAGLEKRVPVFFIVPLAVVVLILHAFVRYDFYPDPCCVLAGNDDAAVMAWVQDQLSVKARIGIASTELNVSASSSEGVAGSDAGIWIHPLTGRDAVLLPYDLMFNEELVLNEVCKKKIGYLFVGEMGKTFDRVKLHSHLEWYTPLLSLGKTGVYEVIGCD